MVDELVSPCQENGVRNVKKEESSMTLWCCVSHGEVHEKWHVGDNTDRQAQKSSEVSKCVCIG